MNILKKLVRPESAKTVTLELVRGCFIQGNRYEAGETVSVSPRIAAELVAANNARNLAEEAAVAAEAARLDALIPPPVEPRPLPEDWKDLPVHFHELWTMEEAANALVERRSQIWDKLMLTMGRYRALGEGLQSFKAAYDEHFGLRTKLQKAFADIHVGGALPEAHLAEVRALKDAFERSEKAVRDWHAANLDRWQKSNFFASQHLLERHGAICKQLRELHALGREIFAERIKALGLAEWKVDELFKGSADAIRYASIAPPTLDDVKLAWADDSGPMHYIAKPPANMVTLLRDWEAIAAQVATLTKQAKAELRKAELRKAQAVTQAA